MDRRAFLAIAASAIAGCNAGIVERPSETPTATDRGTNETARRPTGTPGPTPTRTSTVTRTSTATETETPTPKPEGFRFAPPGESVRLEPIASGLSSPVDMATPPGGGDRSYVIDRLGQLLALDRSTGETDVALDLSSSLVEVESWEQGLLGIAFHPEFADDRRFYLRYSAPLRDGAPEGFSHTFTLSEFRMNEDGTSADPASERIVLEIDEPGPIHNAGGIAFGPDGYLYVGVGDGGGGQHDQGPGHAEDWYEAVAGGNGQDVTENLLGSVLRIDVDDGDGESAYGIPEDNPLVGEEGLDEHYAWGFRNPHRLSFGDGDLFVSDVGQDRFEEVNLVEKGGNYGWNVKEGIRCHVTSPCPGQTADGEPLLDPILTYPHRMDGGRLTAVIGGHWYEGDAVDALDGTYVFADLFTGERGHLFSARPSESSDGGWLMEELVVANRPDGELREAILGFGTDGAGELYVLTTAFSEATGAVYRIAPADG